MADEVVVAHIVHPGSKLRDVALGAKTKAKAMCGAWVKTSASRNTPICRPCFERYRAEGEPAKVTEGAA